MINSQVFNHPILPYQRANRFIDSFAVSTDIDNKAGWKPCFTVEGVRLPTGYYFGMSATTGDLSDNHDIIAVKLYELDSPTDVRIDEWFSFFAPL